MCRRTIAPAGNAGFSVGFLLSAEDYYPLVSEAIRRAELLEDLGSPGAVPAYLDLSLLEERIAEELPASDPEGGVARRGAVRAAISAREYARARQLVERFLAEPDVGADLRGALIQFIQELENLGAERFPRVSQRHGLVAVRMLAHAYIEQAAPFPII